LENIASLGGIGVATEARLDPLIPDLTDTDTGLGALLPELVRRGIRTVAASYLFLRPAFAQRLAEKLRLVQGSSISMGEWGWQALADGVGGGRMIGTEDRRARFSRLQCLAARHGIDVHVCTCKNPDVGADGGCRIAGPSAPPPSADSLPLFSKKETPS
jgi:DNA repair photolyase